MSYVENNLQRGEEIIYCAQIHWAIFLGPIIWAIIALIFFITYIGGDVEFASVIAVVLAIIALFTFFRALITKFSSEYVLTSKRLIMKSGIISRNTLELILTKCEGISIDQSILGRIFGYGTIVATTGGATNKFSKIANPIKFRNRINEQIDTVHNNHE